MMNRRRFLRYLLVGTGLAAAGGSSGLFYATAIEPFAIEVVHQQIALPGLKAGLRGLRAVQISDLHMGMFINQEHLKHAVSLALEQKPDLVLITGDCLTYFGNVSRALVDLEAALGSLASQVPVYAVPGNHDHDEGGMRLRALFSKLGIQMMINTVQPFQKGGDSLYIAGLDSVTAGRPRLSNLMTQVPEDGPTILMVHEPDVADQIAATGKFALQLSGHTHGGQVSLPLVGPLVLPILGRKYPAGLYQVNGMQLYTNRGIGMFHLPIRINCPPEITVFTFEPG